MKTSTLALFLGVLLNLQQVRAQDPVEASKVIVKDGYDHAELAVNPWGGSHGLFFGAKVQYKGSESLWDPGNTVYASWNGQYSYGAFSMGYLANGGQFSFYDGGLSTGAGNTVAWNPVMTLKRGGYMGVGTTNPLSRFHVFEPANDDAYITLERSNNAFQVFNVFRPAGVITPANPIWLAGMKQGSANFEIQTWNGTTSTEHLYINTTGNTGLGTTAPTEKLEVAGSSYINGESAGYIIDANGLKRVGLMKYQGREGGIWRTNSQDFEVGRVNVEALPGNPTAFETDFYVGGNGNVGIGTTDPKGYKLAVNGPAVFTKVVVRANAGSWPDYVFEPSYQLPTLQEVEAFIKANKHLPEVPSAKEVEANGLDLGENQAVLLKKIEEQMLYILELSKQQEFLLKKVAALETELKVLKSEACLIN